MPITPSIKKKFKTSEQTDRPWNVVVLDDPVNLMDYVTLVLQRVFGYTRSRAESLMMEVHENGRSIVWSGSREKAEFYVQQLHAHQLMATMEKER
jgi:ATP-dependent Clp protease adaptor protein ClpS